MWNEFRRMSERFLQDRFGLEQLAQVQVRLGEQEFCQMA
jgi:hypothetical protein